MPLRVHHVGIIAPLLFSLLGCSQKSGVVPSYGYPLGLPDRGAAAPVDSGAWEDPISTPANDRSEGMDETASPPEDTATTTGERAASTQESRSPSDGPARIDPVDEERATLRDLLRERVGDTAPPGRRERGWQDPPPRDPPAVDNEQDRDEADDEMTWMPESAPEAPGAPMDREADAVGPMSTAGRSQMALGPEDLPRARLGTGGAGSLSPWEHTDALVVPLVGDASAAVPNSAIRDALSSDDGIGALLENLSGGAASVYGHVLDPLVLPAGVDALVEELNRGRTATLVAVMEDWARRINLARYDNDGPDGIPSSDDDDGILDLVLIPLLDAREGTPHFRVALNRDLPAGVDRKHRVRVLDVHVYPLQRPDDHAFGVRWGRSQVRMALGWYGIAKDEAFLPVPLDEVVSPMALLNLGWLEARVWDGSGALKLDAALDDPVLMTVDEDRGWILVSHEERLWYAPVQRSGGRLQASRFAPLPRGQTTRLSLNRRDGTIVEFWVSPMDGGYEISRD